MENSLSEIHPDLTAIWKWIKKFEEILSITPTEKKLINLIAD